MRQVSNKQLSQVQEEITEKKEKLDSLIEQHETEKNKIRQLRILRKEIDETKWAIKYVYHRHRHHHHHHHHHQYFFSFCNLFVQFITKK